MTTKSHDMLNLAFLLSSFSLIGLLTHFLCHHNIATHGYQWWPQVFVNICGRQHVCFFFHITFYLTNIVSLLCSYVMLTCEVHVCSHHRNDDHRCLWTPVVINMYVFILHLTFYLTNIVSLLCSYVMLTCELNVCSHHHITTYQPHLAWVALGHWQQETLMVVASELLLQGNKKWAPALVRTG